MADKTRAAASAALAPYVTEIDSRPDDAFAVGNAWSMRLFDGPFYLSPPRSSLRPSCSLVFVQSADGNTGAADPGTLGGGETDKHLIYEGLSRAAADAVMAGAATVEGAETFFSVWHPQMVALRQALGLPRHPAQVVLTGRGCVDLQRTLLFNVPDVPVYIIAAPPACERLEAAVADHPSVELIPMRGDDLRTPLAYLRKKRGIARISCIGGRATATALLDGGYVQDLCLTTSGRSAGEPQTPFYTGKKNPALDPMVRKRAEDPEYPITFEHFAVR